MLSVPKGALESVEWSPDWGGLAKGEIKYDNAPSGAAAKRQFLVHFVTHPLLNLWNLVVFLRQFLIVTSMPLYE